MDSPLFSNNQVSAIWPEQAAMNVNEGENVVVRCIADRPDPAIFNVRVPTLTVHLPDPKLATGAAVVLCPGGGYHMLVIEKEGHTVAQWLNLLGIAAFVLKYRLPDPTRPDVSDPLSLQDARRALRIVRSHAVDFGLQTHRIGIFGASAGGHLAATLSTHFDAGNPEAQDPVERASCRPDFSILLYPVITMDAGTTHAGSRANLIGNEPSAELVERFSNERQVTAKTPPAFLVHADDDGCVPVENSVLYYQALHRAGVSSELHILREGGHGFAMVHKTGPTSSWPSLCEKWLNETVLAADFQRDAISTL